MKKIQLLGLFAGLCMLTSVSFGCTTHKHVETDTSEDPAFMPLEYKNFDEAMEMAQKPYLCVSAQEAQDYMSSTKNVFTYTDEYRSTLDQYDKKFFKDHDLLIITDIEPSGSNILSDAEIESTEDQQMLIMITRQIPEVGTADMAVWQVLLPVEKDEIPKEYSVSIKYDDQMMEE